MMHLLMIIVDDLARLPDLLAAWREIGIGATLVDSQGGYRVSNWLDRFGLGGINRMLQSDAAHSQRTIFSILQTEEKLEQAITEAERIFEGFDRPGSGLLFVLPITRTLGLTKSKIEIPPALSARKDRLRYGIDPYTPVSKIVDILGLKPCIVHRNDSLRHVIQVILSHPSVNVVAVVSEEGRLIGLIDMSSLSRSLFYHIFPETYLAELHDLKSVRQFAQLPHDANTAGDIMQEATYVRKTDTLLTAFKTLQQRDLEGIPIVDEHNRPTDYIHMIELMAVCIRSENIDSENKSLK